MTNRETGGGIPKLIAYLFEDGKGGGVQVNKFADGSWKVREDNGSYRDLEPKENLELQRQEKNGWRVDGVKEDNKSETVVGDSED